ncbi:MAG: succinate dehydrogenase, cytochrome b556 subunit [Pseudomonadota bacterium]|nr:succinate dehydrogenase, cytochrome b556 subunit [Pseudomonadota bacterium]
MTAPTSRPLSPHLTIWKWGPHMLVSILHRVTGSALTFAGLALLTWWLLAIAAGAPAHEQFVGIATHPLGLVVLIGLTWAFWQHFFSGLRHLFMDMGAGYELKTNKLFAVLTIVAALLATAVTWFILMGVNR